MQGRPLVMTFLMDPIESVDIDKDTTFALMLEAQRRGHEVLAGHPRDLFVQDGAPGAHVRPVTLRRERGRHAEQGPDRRVLFDAGVDVVWQRKDPPVDAAYVLALQMLRLCRRALVLNRPEGILAANEKLYTLRFPELMTETRVTRNLSDLLEFLDELGGEMIVKPLHGKGGEGVFYVQRDDRNLYALLEQATGFGRYWTMAQRYLPGIREGDKRILLVEGEPVGAVLRVPAEGEHRANLHVGGRAERATLDEADRRILKTLAPVLRDEGLFFVGIDVIGGRLTEVNVTSPTGAQEIDRLEGISVEAAVLDGAERLVAAHAAAEPPSGPTR